MLKDSDKRRSRPTVSVIIANYNGGAHLGHAIKSVQKQTLRNIEIIVSDDGSDDSSAEVVTRLMADDARIRLLISDSNRGPAAARNKALDIANGEWIAIVDSDDFIHPTRLGTLVQAGQSDGADIVADDLLIFDAGSSFPPKTLLKGRWTKTPFWIDTASFISVNNFYGRGPILGYLKPLFRSALVAAKSVRYNEALRIGEDYNFVLALLRAGARFRVYPNLLYFYRKHSSSTSYRLQTMILEALKHSDLQLLDALLPTEQQLRIKINARIRSIDTALGYEDLLHSLKAGNWIQASRTVAANPRTIRLLRLPILSRLRRLWQKFTSRHSKSDKRQVCILSRQRVVGRTNGSSVYLLDLAEAIAKYKVDVHFLSPSPTTLGRWPYIALSDDLSIFKTVRIRGTWRLGRYLISVDPTRFVRCALAVCDMMAVKLGITARSYSKKDPYSIAQPLTRRDQLYIARKARKIGDFLIADYCFLTHAVGYALRPDAGSMVIMHDRVSSRSGEFESLKREDVEVSLTEEEECDMLGFADSIVTIQWEEADFVHQRLPGHRIIVAPLAARPIDAPEPGRDDHILFVGSAATANVDGLQWFIDHCWKTIHRLHPTAKLCIAGTVSRFMGPLPDGIFVVGLVKDLDPLYRRAGVIISPLRIGSGLKIKLIEALSRGKSVVGTAKTLQGVAEYLSDCIVIEDDPERFARAIVRLLADRNERIALAARGLHKIREHFTPEKCYGTVLKEVVGQ
jgi:glycosyltransferase involved in cell wall biosynthesis